MSKPASPGGPADRGWGARRDKVRELRQALLFAAITCHQATATEEHAFLGAQISKSEPLVGAGEEVGHLGTLNKRAPLCTLWRRDK
jgi:hypothetical protein